jgi:hypothetical protein
VAYKRDLEDVVVSAVVDGAGERGIAADEDAVGEGERGALDVVRVAVAAVEDGRVESLRDLVDVCAIKEGGDKGVVAAGCLGIRRSGDWALRMKMTVSAPQRAENRVWRGSIVWGLYLMGIMALHDVNILVGSPTRSERTGWFWT